MAYWSPKRQEFQVNRKGTFRPRRPNQVLDEKPCTACKDVLPLASFHARKGSADGKRAVCKRCVRATRDNRRREHPKEHLVATMKLMAKRLGVGCDLTEEDLVIEKECPRCERKLGAIPLSHDRRGNPAVVRLDREMGYTFGNVEVVCYRCARSEGQRIRWGKIHQKEE